MQILLVEAHTGVRIDMHRYGIEKLSSGQFIPLAVAR